MIYGVGGQLSFDSSQPIYLEKTQKVYIFDENFSMIEYEMLSQSWKKIYVK